MQNIEMLNQKLEELQKRLHKMKKENIVEDKFLHSGEFTIMKLIANYQMRTDKNPTSIILSNKLEISQATITTLTDRLIKKGLITKETSPKDKRVKELALTDKGKEFLEFNYQKKLKVLKTMTEGLGQEDTTKLIDIVDKINENLELQNKGAKDK